MLRRRIAVIAVIAVGSVVLSPSPAEAVKGVVKGMSHGHPSGESVSYVAARVKGSRRARVSAHLAGPGVESTNPVECTIPRKRKFEGKVVVVWRISEPGEYTVHLTVTKSGDSANDQRNYTVPAPKPRWGPFHFPTDPGCHKGWPTS